MPTPAIVALSAFFLPMTDSPLSDGKPALRALMKTQRAEAHGKNPQFGLRLRDHFLKAVEIPPASVIAGYAAVAHEADPLPLMEALHARGHALCLPAVEGMSKPLLFRAYAPGDALVKHGTLKIPEPAAEKPLARPDILLVPLLAFDRHGHRLGYGGGHYDRTLAALRAQKRVVAIGIAFACQEVGRVPTHSGDVRLDKIVTENQVFHI